MDLYYDDSYRTHMETTINMITIDIISYSEKEKIGEGKSIVYKGKYGHKDAAVKKMYTEDKGDDSLKRMNHHNVVKILSDLFYLVRRLPRHSF